MSLDIVGKLCREFKILRQKCNLSIDYNMGGSILLKICLNYETNVDIAMERIAFKHLVFKNYKLQNQKWFLEPEYVSSKVTAGINYIRHENVVEFLLTQRDPLVRCENLGKICQLQFIMDDFLFDNKIFQHFKYLMENSELFASFNID